MYGSKILALSKDRAIPIFKGGIMEYKEGYVYHIKDSYFDKVNDDKLMANKENGNFRPTFFCLKDNETGLLWVVPMSSKYDKYKAIGEKQTQRYGKSVGIVLGESAFPYARKCAINKQQPVSIFPTGCCFIFCYKVSKRVFLIVRQTSV